MMWNIFILVVLAFADGDGDLGSVPAERFIATECYGNVLSISCKAGHRIKVLDDFFGVSTRPPGLDSCQYQPDDCTVTNSRHTSVIHRYCEGRQDCNSFQVDRRFCGHNQTNYEQVEYKCVPDMAVTNMCSATSYTTRSGYLATPNFPHEYPTNLHCGCALGVNQKGTRVQLEATHFIIKYDSPCKDWLEITMGGQMRRLCGAYRSTLFSEDFNLTFHTDDNQGHQGLWLYFSVYPQESNGTLLLTCGKLALPDTSTTTSTTTTTTTATTTTSSTTTSSTPTSGPQEVHVLTNKPTLFPIDKDTGDYRRPPDPGGNKELPPAATQEEEQQNKENIFPFPPNHGPPGKKRTENEIHKAWESAMENRWKDMLESWFTSPRPPTWRLGTQTQTPITSTDNVHLQPWLRPGSENGEGLSIGQPLPPKKPKLGDTDRSDDERRKNNQITGMIIISTCVGGILLLVVILTVFLCISKRKRPQQATQREMRQHNERLQQRLNSLSFYDSIPLYDSMGRRTLGVARAPNPMTLETQSLQHRNRTKERPVVSNAKQKNPAPPPPAPPPPPVPPIPQEPQEGEWKSNGNGPYWANLQSDPDSDHDSAIYAELDKQSKDGMSEGVDTPSTLPRRADYAVHLQNNEDDEVYTHV